MPLKYTWVGLGRVAEQVAAGALAAEATSAGIPGELPFDAKLHALVAEIAAGRVGGAASGGSLPTVASTVARDALSPADNDLVVNLEKGQIEQYVAGSWVPRAPRDSGTINVLSKGAVRSTTDSVAGLSAAQAIANKHAFNAAFLEMYEYEDSGKATSATSLSLTDSSKSWVVDEWRELIDTGTSSGGNTSTTLNDTSKAWAPSGAGSNEHNARTVYIRSGTGAGQVRHIGSNTATELTLGSDTPWTVTPDATSVYDILATSALKHTDEAWEVAIIEGPGQGQWRLIVGNTADTLVIDRPWDTGRTPTSASRYRIHQSAYTSTRHIAQPVYAPGGVYGIYGEIDTCRSHLGSALVGDGFQQTVLKQVAPSHAKSSFASATATSITVSPNPGWNPNGWIGWWVFVWAKAASDASEPLYYAVRVTGNTNDTVQVASWGGTTPDPATMDFAIGQRSTLHVNGTAYSDWRGITLDGGAEQNKHLAVFTWLPPAAYPTDFERVARSASENTFYNVEAAGKWIMSGLQHGDRGGGGSYQVDNSSWFHCRASGGYTPGDIFATRSHWKNGISVGGGVSGNAVINRFYGGSVLLCQSGLECNNTDVGCYGLCFQSNGVPDDDTTGDISVNGVTHFFRIGEIRSELSARLVGIATASVANQCHAEIRNVDFHINGNLIFADNGVAIKWTIPGTVEIHNIRLSGNDPTSYASPRFAQFQFGNTRGQTINMSGILVVGSNIEEAFAAGASHQITMEGYSEIDTSNIIVKHWGGRLFISGTDAPMAHVDQKHWFMVAGTAPDTNYYREAAAQLRTDHSLRVGQAFATIPSTPAWSGSITIDAKATSDVEIVASTGIATTIQNPTGAVAGQLLEIEFLNSSGGAMGAITWGSEFKLAGAFTNPANGTRRSIVFRRNSANTDWIERNRNAADVA